MRMTKVYLSAAAILVALTARAESVKLEWLSGNNDGVTAPSLKGNSDSDEFVALDVEVGSGLEVSGNEITKVIDKDGVDQNVVGGNFAKVIPAFDSRHEPISLEEAEEYDSYLAFAEESRMNARLYPQTVMMDLTGEGTDLVRMQVVLKGEGTDGSFSYTVLTPDNCHEFAPDGGWAYGYLYGNSVSGWRPSRNDGSKEDYLDNGSESIQSEEGFTHLVIPVEDIDPELLKTGCDNFTVVVYMWGTTNNKAYGIRNVIVEGSDTPQTSSISNIAADGIDTDAAICNILGQRVSKDYKGLLIQNGRKFYNR